MTRRALTVAALTLTLACCGAPEPPPTASVPGPPPVVVASPQPTAVHLPTLGVSSTLTRTGMLPSGAPEVPPVTDPMQASWATWSPEPGTPGPATLYGHVDGVIDGQSGQPGIFARADELAVNDRIIVDQTDGTPAVFAVYDVRSYPKTDVPEAEVYGNTAGPELRLVTCGGSFDPAADSYRDQIVVYAREISP